MCRFVGFPARQGLLLHSGIFESSAAGMMLHAVAVVNRFGVFWL